MLSSPSRAADTNKPVGHGAEIPAGRGPSAPTDIPAELENVVAHAPQLENVVAHAPVVLLSFDADGILSLCEGRGLDALGFHSRELVGVSVFEALRAYPWLAEGARRALAGETVTAAGEAMQGAWLEEHFVPLRASGSDTITGALAIVTDITARKCARDALDQQQAVLKYVIANVPHAIFWKDLEGRFMGGNQHFLNDTGARTLENLLGKTDYDVWRREDADSFVKVDHAVMASGTPILDVEEPVLRSDGQERVLLTSKVPMLDEGGRITGLLGIYADITERKQMEVELQKAKEAADAAARAKGEFLTVMSHELRTPLSLILGPLASLLSSEGEKLSPRARSDLELILRNARRLHRLVDDVLDHQKIEAGKMQIDWQASDVVELVTEMVEDARPSAESSGITLSLQVDPGLPSIPVDRRKFEKIALNLLGNALKFTPPTGRVAVVLRALDGQLELAVEDTGPGIPKDKLHLLFQRFQQIDTSITRKYEGTGIGLSLAKEFAEMMGGTIGVTSEPGKGARFVARFPCSPDRLIALPSEGRDEAPRGPRLLAGDRGFTTVDACDQTAIAGDSVRAREAKPRLLVVEDNADMRSYLAQTLAAEWDVQLATNGREALAAADARRPEVIVSDVMMPEMDGYELVTRIKRDPVLLDIPVILLTARAGRAEAVGGLDVGADDYLAKPFDPAELKARIRAAARLHRVYLELAAKKGELEATLERLAETQEELIQAGKMAAVGTLIAGLSHEMNNPVSIILMNVEILLRGQREGSCGIDGASLEKSLPTIKANANRCASLVRSLLEYTRRRPPTRELCDVHAAIQRALELSLPEAKKRMVRIEVQRDATLPAVLVNATQLDSALLNLIGNALDAVPSGASILVATRPFEREGVPGVEIEVRDTGCGIRPEDLEHIFDPFFTTKAPGHGTGLGLSMTRRFLTEHRGEIHIESELGAGTTVFMWLPAAARDAPRVREDAA